MSLWISGDIHDALERRRPFRNALGVGNHFPTIPRVGWKTLTLSFVPESLWDSEWPLRLRILQEALERRTHVTNQVFDIGFPILQLDLLMNELKEP